MTKWSDIQRWALVKACFLLAPHKIPMSGPECESNDFYTIKFNFNDSGRVLVKGIQGYTVSFLAWDKSTNSYNTEGSIEVSEIDLSTVEITHYLHAFYTTYSSVNGFIFHCLTKKDYIKIKCIRAWQKLTQTVFNRFELQSKPRHELLDYLVNCYGIHRKQFGLISLMSDVYSIRSFGHPDKETCKNKLRLYLESLVDSGELVKVANGDFKVTGKAVVTLELFQHEERRHRDSLRSQYIMVALTLCLAMLASIQAGLIKLKPILDLTQ
ncbi:hypothetical protein TUM4644_36770 [Shewanella colwelliana]|uniref:hypothetical protein n=1 Tax=Shewanella colwelliana TaxID=23 RepID=UPI001BBDE40E|nr:hypothetical protein [Shewanella colwelliana]GIU35555.1 hypothetical protein TUM4644_36770 [Shewanella colwelliana]